MDTMPFEAVALYLAMVGQLEAHGLRVCTHVIGGPCPAFGFVPIGLVVCHKCVPDMSVMEAMRDLDDSRCDSCGATSEVFHPHMMVCGAVTVCGDICPDCHEWAKRFM